jgi:hypothetical protein
MNRELVYAALYAKLAASAGFVTTSRKLRHWSDVAAEEQPALFVIQTNEPVQQQRGMPPKWTLRVNAYIYVNTQAQSDTEVVPSQLLNPLLDAVEAVLAPDDVANYVQTLGGLVSHCWIEGPIETSEGCLGDQEVAIVPIAMLVPF